MLLMKQLMSVMVIFETILFENIFLSVLTHDLDINECNDGNGNCFDRCVNTIGSFYCLCSSEFIFADDNHTCIRK